MGIQIFRRPRSWITSFRSAPSFAFGSSLARWFFFASTNSWAPACFCWLDFCWRFLPFLHDYETLQEDECIIQVTLKVSGTRNKLNIYMTEIVHNDDCIWVQSCYWLIAEIKQHVLNAERFRNCLEGLGTWMHATTIRPLHCVRPVYPLTMCKCAWWTVPQIAVFVARIYATWTMINQAFFGVSPYVQATPCWTYTFPHYIVWCKTLHTRLWSGRWAG